MSGPYDCLICGGAGRCLHTRAWTDIARNRAKLSKGARDLLAEADRVGLGRPLSDADDRFRWASEEKP